MMNCIIDTVCLVCGTKWFCFITAGQNWRKTSACVLVLQYVFEIVQGKQFVNWFQFCFHSFHSLVPGKFEWHFRYLIFQIISVINDWGSSCELAHRWMLREWLFMISQHWFRQWLGAVRQQAVTWANDEPDFLSPYGVTRPQWVNSVSHWPLGDLAVIIKTWFSHLWYRIMCRHWLIEIALKWMPQKLNTDLVLCEKS